MKKPGELGCFLWDVDSNTVRKNRTLSQTNMRSAQFVARDPLVGSVLGETKSRYFVVYDFRNDSLAQFEVTDEERHLLTARGLIFSPDFKMLIGQRYMKPILTLREWETSLPKRQVEISAGYPNRCCFSADGRYLIVASNTSDGQFRPAKVVKSYLSIYDATTLKIKKSQQVLTRELKESWVVNVGYQMAVSPDGRWLVVGFDRYTEKLAGFMSYLRATYAILEFPSLKQVAWAEHPEIRTSYEWAEVSPAQGGRLRFDADSSGFYTTAKYTVHWALPD